MSIWRQIRRGLDVLWHREAADRELSEEMAHYVEEAEAAQVRKGLTLSEARRRARLDLGSPASVREEVRSAGWENLIATAIGDVRFAVRGLAAAPAFTFVTVFTLALGLGAITAVLSAVIPILVEPLPYPDAGRLVAVVEGRPEGGRSGGTFGMYHAFAERGHAFDGLAVTRVWQPTLTDAVRPQRIEGQRVSEAYFRVLGVAPVMGREFAPVEDRLRGPRVVVLSDGFWRSHLASDPAVLGRSLLLDGDPYRVVGVMPPKFQDAGAPAAELWAPLQYDLSLGTAWGHHLRTLARLRPGVGMDQASRDVNEVGRAVLTEQHPETYDPETQFWVTSLRGEITGGVRPALLTLLGAVALVLLIALVNVTNLLLARGVRRRSEFALRAALGAGRARLIRQVLTESLVLGLVGGAFGLVVAALGVKALIALSPAGLPRAGAIAVNGSVFAIGAVIATLAGVAVGVIPAFQATRVDPQGDLQRGSLRTVGGHRRARAILVVSEVALALVLLVGSGLLLRSLNRLFAVNAGFDQGPLLTLKVQLGGHRFDDDSTAARFFAHALDAVRQVPGVTAAACTNQLPLSTDDDEYGATFEAGPGQQAATYNVFRYAVSPGYLETMGIPLLGGRRLNDGDRAGAPAVVVISASLARERFGTGDPLGQRLLVGPAGPFTIVGVVGDVHQASLAAPQGDAVYIPAVQWRQTDRAMSFVVRSQGTVTGLALAIQSAIWSVGRDQSIERIASMSALIAGSAANRRFVLTLFEGFALAALGLAAAGIYGVLSGSVTERSRELGIRTALGASGRQVVRMVLGEGAVLAGSGAAIGLVAAAGLSRIIVSLLFNTSPVDAGTYLAVTALLAVVSLVACWVPAVRAARIDPIEALRAE